MLLETPSPVDVAMLRREVELEKRLLEIQTENAIVFYMPHEKQANFHRAANFHYRYARTGNRFGKSEMGSTEDIAYARGAREWLDKDDPYRTLGIPQRPTKGLIVTTDWDKSEEVFTSLEAGPNVGKLFKYIPKSALVGYTRNHSGAIDLIRVKHLLGGVSVIHLDTVKSFKQNKLGQESSWWDWIHYDEPVPEEMYKANIRGLMDRDGSVWFTCTPLEEPWIDEKFIPDMEDQTKEDVSVANGDFWMMTGRTDDNPHNTPEAIERVMSQYTAEEQETRRSGVPKAYHGLVYKEFEWSIHVRKEPPPGWKDWYTPPNDYCIRFAIDYHPRKPHHVLFIATSPQGYQYVYAEVFLSCLMSDLVAECRMILKLRDATVPGLIDPLAGMENRVTDSTAIDELIRLGLPVLPATKDPHNGILKVKAHLKERDREGQPTMLFNPDLRRTLMEISRGYVWDGETNKPVKDKDDAMENLYRLCLQGLHYVEPSTTADNVIPFYDIPAVDFRLNPFQTELGERRAVSNLSRYRK